MDIHLFIGDVDEFYCNAVEGSDRRWAVWSSCDVPLGANDPARNRGAVSRNATSLIARFDTLKEAEQFVKEYDVGPGNVKIIK